VGQGIPAYLAAWMQYAYRHSVGAFGFTVVGSVAGVVGAMAAILFGVLSFLRRRGLPQRPTPEVIREPVLPAPDVESPVVVGEIPQEPLGFQPRTDLLAALDESGRGSQVVVHAVTGMPGVGKTQLAAAYARARLAERFRLVAWVNAEDPVVMATGLATVAEAMGLESQGARDPGLVVRHWLEVGGDRCLIVFDNVSDADSLRPYMPAAGSASVLITSNRESVVNLGTSVEVGVFTAREALAYLTDQAESADTEGAAAVAAELGYLPLALAQAAAVIAGQHLSYGTYLERLRRLPVEEYTMRGKGQPYPRGVAETVLLSLEAAKEGDQTGLCTGVMEMMSVLSPTGVRRDLLHDFGQRGGPADHRHGSSVPAHRVDEALGQLAERSLLTFSLDNQTVNVHRLVMRVIRDGLARRGRLAAACRFAASVLDTRAKSLVGSSDRQAVRDIPQQVEALYCLANETGLIGGGDSELVTLLLSPRFWALYHLNDLGDSALQAIAVGEPLIADVERVLGPDHEDALTRVTALLSPTGWRVRQRRRSRCTRRTLLPGRGCWVRMTPRR
jgi:hypothetical protein